MIIVLFFKLQSAAYLLYLETFFFTSQTLSISFHSKKFLSVQSMQLSHYCQFRKDFSNKLRKLHLNWQRLYQRLRDFISIVKYRIVHKNGLTVTFGITRQKGLSGLSDFVWPSVTNPPGFRSTNTRLARLVTAIYTSCS